MREILFRGKRTDNGDWHEGEDIMRNTIRGKVCLAKIGEDWISVDPETICQFTGLYDKNGRKIFEGDIIGTDIARPYLIVEFRDGCFMFNCNDGGKDYYDIMLPILEEAQTEYKYGEVIGNIYDNKLEDFENGC